MSDSMLATLLFGFPLPPEMVDPRYPAFIQRAGGLVLTLWVTVASLLAGGVLGAVLALARREATPAAGSGPIDRHARALVGLLAAAIILVVRNLPIMIVVLATFYLPYSLFQVRIPGVVLAIVAFSLYTAVYLTEILRSGFRAVGTELSEAARVLGMTRMQIFLRVELPIAARTMRPDLLNLAITVFKDTSTLSIVAVAELTYVARQTLAARPLEYELALLLVLALYWVPSTLLSMLATRLALPDRRRVAPRVGIEA
jgi:ABC-type amino acid transport system permease subunit